MPGTRPGLSPRLAGRTPFAAADASTASGEAPAARLVRGNTRLPGNPVSLLDQRVELVLRRRRGRVGSVPTKGDRTAPGLCPPDLAGRHNGPFWALKHTRVKEAGRTI